MPYNSHTDQYYSPPSSGEIMTLTYMEQAQRAVNNYMLHTVGLGDKALSFIHLELLSLPAVQQYLTYGGHSSYAIKQIRWLISNGFKLYIDSSGIAVTGASVAILGPSTKITGRTASFMIIDELNKPATSLPATGTAQS